ncbi:hypothetical protein GCM10023144_32240 [Pigmentiphaga soli]|uniref:Uncharacterized protein n=1 Tax=Pigmentiphaga soli TaxID=1007095 RepID=A0ABP8HC52_9BURK
MAPVYECEEIRRLLLELNSLLLNNGEENWRRGIKAAIGELTNGGGEVNSLGWENARSIYKTMNEGGRGFAEYFFWSDDETKRILANEKLDALRAKLWEAFDL